MSDTTGVPTDQSESVTYAEIQDVQDILRAFEFSQDSNPNTSQVERKIQQKTREIERDIPTSFRELEISNLSVNVTPSSKQKRNDTNNNRGSHVIQGFNARGHTTDRFVDVYLPHYFVQDVSRIVVKTSTGEREIDFTEDQDKYSINYRDGKLKIDYRLFPSTASGTAGSNRMRDARVEVDYTYGREFIESDIKQACAKLVVYDLLSSDAFSEIRSEEEAFLDIETFTSRIENQANDILEDYKY